MDVKLTLKLDRSVIEKAKEYAAAHNKSLSRMVESYLQSLVDKNAPDPENDEITPFVKSLKSGVKLPAGLDHKQVYRDHIQEKYQ